MKKWEFRRSVIVATKKWLNGCIDCKSSVKLIDGAIVAKLSRNNYSSARAIPWDVIEIDTGVLFKELELMRRDVYEHTA